MTHQAAATGVPTHASSGGVVLALRVLSTLNVLNILFQGATAGELLMANHAALAAHQAGAIVLHVLAGLTAIAAIVLWRWARTQVWPSVIGALVFVASFVQAAFGHGRTLYIHVPLALTLLVGAAAVMTWAWMYRRS
jgi:hypothetical protein